MAINTQTTVLPGVLIIEPRIFSDNRGYFLETFHSSKYNGIGITQEFIQDNLSLSKKDTIRGLHAQLGNPQHKLVRVVRGAVLDVAVDARPSSKTFGKHVAIELNADTHRQLFIPAGYFHGFCALENDTVVEYKCSAFYSPGDEATLLWNDPKLAIPWPSKSPLVSPKDREGLGLDEIASKVKAAAKVQACWS